MIYEINILNLKINNTDVCQTKRPNLGVISRTSSDLYTSYGAVVPKLRR